MVKNIFGGFSKFWGPPVQFGKKIVVIKIPWDSQPPLKNTNGQFLWLCCVQKGKILKFEITIFGLVHFGNPFKYKNWF